MRSGREACCLSGRRDELTSLYDGPDHLLHHVLVTQAFRSLEVSQMSMLRRGIMEPVAYLGVLRMQLHKTLGPSVTGSGS